MLPRRHPDRIRIAFDVTVQTWRGELFSAKAVATGNSFQGVWGMNPPT